MLQSYCYFYGVATSMVRMYRVLEMARNTSETLRRQIGERLRELRVTAEISSQEELAHRAGVHRTYVGRLERGESGVTLDSLAAILAVIEISLAEFFEPFDKVVRPRTPRRR